MFRPTYIKLLFTLVALLAWSIVPVRAATVTVSTTADSGVGSLRAALTSAVSGDSINFTTSGTIQLLSNLPFVTQTNLTINGNGATILGGADIRIFTISGGASVNINNLTLQNGACNGGCPGNLGARYGGAIFNDGGTLTLTGTTLSGNSVGGNISLGGAIYSNGTLTINNSTLSGNSADAGGGIYNDTGTLTISNSTLSGNSSIMASIGGGGIYTINGTMTLTASTLSGNSATNSGGGILIANNNTITINNSTLSGNSVGSIGGGLVVDGSTNVTVTNSTVSGNTADAAGGIFINGSVTLINSTVYGNTALGVWIPVGGIINFGTVYLKNSLIGKGTVGANCYGTITTNGAAHNLSDDASCGADVTQVGALQLGTLGSNGGSTQTIPLLAGSPAIDAALPADCPATDQRGFARSVGTGCDIGAFEYGAVAPVVLAPTALPSSNSALPALCSLPGFPASTQVSMFLPTGNNGLNVCYSLLSDPVQVGLTAQPFTLAAEVYTFDAYGSVTVPIPVQVCLQGVGTLLYRDASGQPRTTVNLPSFTQNGFTCGRIPHAGTVILVPGAASPVAPAPLGQCTVTTTHILNLRAEPDATSAVLTRVPYQTTLSASERAGEWLHVVFGDQQGWLSASYLTLNGVCV